MSEDQSTFQEDLLATVPQLRTYARLLCRQQHRADDLVQETLLRALENQSSLRERAAMKSWLFTIMRNALYNGTRQLKYEVADEDGIHAEGLSEPASQEHTAEVNDTLRALNTLDADVREVMLLVFVNGMAYEEVASVCNCAVGTVKSRVSRGRKLLNIALEQTTKEDKVSSYTEPQKQPDTCDTAETENAQLSTLSHTTQQHL